MTDAEKITRLFAALGAEDPESWAGSEVREDLPQLARYRLLRALWQDIRAWDSASVDSLRDATDAQGATAPDHAVDLGRLARLVARETTFGVLYRLADPDGDDLPAGMREQMPGWVLTETTPAGEPTHRVLGALYEDLNTMGDPSVGAPRGRTVAEGWIWGTNLRPFCEALAAEVASTSTTATGWPSRQHSRTPTTSSRGRPGTRTPSPGAAASISTSPDPWAAPRCP
ncbi:MULTISPECIES: hypothetical protein [Streptomyces]|uniref:hypothetical protein n=1 Tax=Streptomyces TaxID=1883 RepID=UPI0007C5B411|nr:hypothetical protein [Streptomyces sp. NRRL F-3307]